MVDKVTIKIKPDGRGSYLAECNEKIISARAAGRLHLVLKTPGWRFSHRDEPPAGFPSYRCPPDPDSGKPCGIWIDDPNEDFRCVSFDGDDVVLHNSNRDRLTKPDHDYVAVMTDGSVIVELDPIIRDTGPHFTLRSLAGAIGVFVAIIAGALLLGFLSRK